MQEEWRAIREYEQYQVSNLGRIMNGDGSIKTLRVNKFGYVQVSLSRNCHAKTFLVHRLVADAFLGASRLQVNHIDGVKSNNAVPNLQYLTAQENTQHALSVGLRPRHWKKPKASILRGERAPGAKLSDRDVVEIFNMRASGLSQWDIAQRFHCSQVHIGKILRGHLRSDVVPASALHAVKDIHISLKGVKRPAKGCGKRGMVVKIEELTVRRGVRRPEESEPA